MAYNCLNQSRTEVAVTPRFAMFPEPADLSVVALKHLSGWLHGDHGNASSSVHIQSLARYRVKKTLGGANSKLGCALYRDRHTQKLNVVTFTPVMS